MSAADVSDAGLSHRQGPRPHRFPELHTHRPDIAVAASPPLLRVPGAQLRPAPLALVTAWLTAHGHGDAWRVAG